MAEERESWGSHLEFFLSSLGLAVGLGNVWRFPYVAFENGGGSFLIPYTLALFFVGLPSFFIELSAGQYGRVGANKVWGRMVPALSGLGYGMIFVRFLVNIYYVVICSWVNIYLVVGFQSQLPWENCGDLDVNTITCYTVDQGNECQQLNQTYFNNTCMDPQQFCEHFDKKYDEGFQGFCSQQFNETDNSYQAFEDVYNRTSPAYDYYFRKVLGLVYYDGESRTFSDYGSLKWELVVSLLVSWILICLILIKGLKSLGKASYVITLSPFFVLTILLIYSLINGQWKAAEGIKQFFTPDWDLYTSSSSYQIWGKAASQILFSLSVGFGSQLVLSSYNQVNNNCHRDAWLIGILNSFTSVFAGVTVFSILGNLADGGDVTKVLKDGIGLAFVAYPEAVLQMNPPPLWSFLFFFMLINLALSSICSGVQTFLAFVLDEKPEWTKYRMYIVMACCAVFFLMGLPMCTEGGLHLFKIFDKRCTSSLLLLVLVEMILISYMYGANKFMGNVEEMGISMPSWLKKFWIAMWVVVTPLIIAVITVLTWVDYEPMSYTDNNGKVYEYPAGAQVAGWVFEILPTAITVSYFLYSLVKRGVADSFKPSPTWETTNASSILAAQRWKGEGFTDDVYDVTKKEDDKESTRTSLDNVSQISKKSE